MEKYFATTDIDEFLKSKKNDIVRNFQASGIRENEIKDVYYHNNEYCMFGTDRIRILADFTRFLVRVMSYCCDSGDHWYLKCENEIDYSIEWAEFLVKKYPESKDRILNEIAEKRKIDSYYKAYEIDDCEERIKEFKKERNKRIKFWDNMKVRIEEITKDAGI